MSPGLFAACWPAPPAPPPSASPMSSSVVSDGAPGPLDYDDSLVPGQIVVSILHLPHVTARDDRDIGWALRWSYGSAFGLYHGLLRRRIGEPWASAVFGGTLMSATFSLFPLLGRTPPPWRWPPDVMATCLGTHAAYVAAVAAVDDQVRRRGAQAGA